MHSFAFLGLDSLEYFSNLLTFNMFVLSFKGQILSHLWVKRTSKTFMKWFIRILFWNLNMIFCTYLNNSRVFSFTDMFLFFFKGQILSHPWAMRPSAAFTNWYILTSVNAGWSKCILSLFVALIALNIWGWRPIGSLRFHPHKVFHQTWGKYNRGHTHYPILKGS